MCKKQRGKKYGIKVIVDIVANHMANNTGSWYFFDNNGSMQASGWIKGVYYMKADGSMAVSEWVEDGKYFVDENGKLVANP